MKELISYLCEIYVEGQRYILLNALSGTLAKMNVPLDVSLELYYNHLLPQDDENREHIIRYTYEKYESGKPIQTLYSLKDLPEFQKLYYLVAKYFDKYKYIQHIYSEEDLNLDLVLYKETTINLDLISMEITPHLTPIAYKYLQLRKITDENIKKYNIRVGKGKLKEYVIFPVFDKGKCVYYVGRNYVGGNPRYKNAKGSKSSYIWFSDDRNSSDTIVICEGIINAITVANYTGLLTCAVFGKTLSKIQIMKLQRYNNIIFNFDGDVDKFYIYDKILPNFSEKNVMIVNMPVDKDANDMTRQEYLEYFLRREVINELDFFSI